jgi:NAD(P)-dependent dehydrogenase (short-subunit alcohol dehydrogenase family)
MPRDAPGGNPGSIRPMRSAIVTGAAQGIGRRVAEVLAGEGYALVLCDVREPEETLAAVQDAGADAVAVVGDLAEEPTGVAAAGTAVAAFGRLDVLVNNAGISHIAPAERTATADWRRVLDVNLTAAFVLSREAGRAMLERGEGSIVNVASIAGLRGIAERAAYNASKHGLVGLTCTLAAEWGGRGVRCNAVCPAWVKTEMDVADQEHGGYTDADITGRVPMGRFAAPEDIAQAVAFLADPARSGFVNGQALAVDGGWIADGSWDRLRQRQR